jgi:hypothetical protein
MKDLEADSINYRVVDTNSGKPRYGTAIAQLYSEIIIN